MNCSARHGADQRSGRSSRPRSRRSTTQATWTHQWRTAVLSTDAYRQSQAGQLVNARRSPAPPEAAVRDPSARSTRTTARSCPTVAGGPDVYVSQPVNGTTRMYQGFDISARIGLGRDVTVIPSYSTNAPFYIAADPLFTGTGSTLILGSQIFGPPAAQRQPHASTRSTRRAVSSFSPTRSTSASNNAQHIAPYVDCQRRHLAPVRHRHADALRNEPVQHRVRRCSRRSTARIPQPLAGGGFLLTAARPLPPRTITDLVLDQHRRAAAAPASRAVRGGTRRAAPRKRRRPGARRAAPRSASAELNFIAPPPGTDPLARGDEPHRVHRRAAAVGAEGARPSSAQPARAYAAGATACRPSPAITVTPHGDRNGAWYFALGPDIPRALPASERPAPRARAPGGPAVRAGSARAGDGPGGPAPGFQPQIPSAQAAGGGPRPAFTPSPA